jgi:hypothetical protein
MTCPLALTLVPNYPHNGTMRVARGPKQILLADYVWPHVPGYPNGRPVHGEFFPATHMTFDPFPCKRANCPCTSSESACHSDYCCEDCSKDSACATSRHYGSISALQAQYWGQQTQCSVSGCGKYKHPNHLRCCGIKHARKFVMSYKANTT